MAEVLLSSLPLAIVSAISATSFVIFFAVLSGKSRQVGSGLAFIIGGVIANFIIAMIVIFFVGNSPIVKSNPHNLAHAIGDFIIAALAIVIIVVKALKDRKPKPAKTNTRPGSILAYAGYGFGLRVASANCLPPYIAAIHMLAMTKGVAVAEVISASLVINFISLLPLILALLMFLLFKEKALKLLSPISSFLGRNSGRIFYITLVLVAGYLVVKGIGHLHAL
ncbi:MAG: GAP family protein [Bacillota bacterium]